MIFAFEASRRVKLWEFAVLPEAPETGGIGKEARDRELVAGALMPGVPGPGGCFREQPAKRTALAARTGIRAERGPKALGFACSDMEKNRR